MILPDLVETLVEAGVREQTGEEHLRVAITTAPTTIPVRRRVMVHARTGERARHIRRVAAHRLDSWHNGAGHRAAIVNTAALRRAQIQRALIIISDTHLSSVHSALHIRHGLLTEVALVIHAILSAQQFKLTLLSLAECLAFGGRWRCGREVVLHVATGALTLEYQIISNNSHRKKIIRTLSSSRVMPHTGQEKLEVDAGDRTSLCSMFTCSSRSGAELNAFVQIGHANTSLVEPPTDGEVKSKCCLVGNIIFFNNLAINIERQFAITMEIVSKQLTHIENFENNKHSLRLQPKTHFSHFFRHA